MELNWPATALILGLAALGVFRVPLARLLDRTEKVKDWLVAPNQPAVPAPSDQGLPTRDASDEQRGFEELTRGFSSQMLLLQEEAIRVDLAKHGFTSETACEKILLKHLAGTQIALHFEKTYNDIFSSQLQALRWLNAQHTGVHSDKLKPFFESGAASWPALYQDRDFQSWLGFMAAQGLITESAESANAPGDRDPFDISITVSGREFLAFLVNTGRADRLVG